MEAHRKRSIPAESYARAVSNVVPLAERGRELSDAVLVRATLEGSEWAKEVLFKRHLRPTYGFAFRLMGGSEDLQDIVQESLTIAFGSLSSLRDPQLFSTWLGRVVINTVRRTLRRRRLLRRLGLRGAGLEQDVSQLTAPSAPPDAALEIEMLYRVLRRLPDKHRIALVLRRVEALTLPEIAQQMGTSEATVKRWLSKAEAAFEAQILHERPSP
jgi:RNA polymerase sigma-70 factor (ECF subfamily)